MSDVFAFPNQKIITVNKDKSNDDYISYSEEWLLKALKELDGYSLKIWFYLKCEGCNNNRFALSSKDACEKCSMGRNTFCKHINILIEKGYLLDMGDNVYKLL